MNQSISGSFRDRRPEVTVVGRTIEEGASVPTRTDEISSFLAECPWVLEGAPPYASPTPQVPTFHEPPRVPMQTCPACVEKFVSAVAKIPEVQCIVVEDEENDAVHITTFATPLSDGVRERVYDIEADIIEANPELKFDFHLRRADEVTGETGEGESRVSGRHYFAVWGSLNAYYR